MQAMTRPDLLPMLSSDSQIESWTDTVVKEKLMFKTVLFNDESHTYDYVVEMLTLTCQLSADSAFRCAVEVDMSGKTIVFNGSHENCLFASEKIKSYGPDHRLPHSMG